MLIQNYDKDPFRHTICDSFDVYVGTGPMDQFLFFEH